MKSALAFGTLLLASFASLSAQKPAPPQAPYFDVDPYWPKPLPNNWVIGSTIGVSVDSQDHVWIIHRPQSVDENFKAGDLKIGICGEHGGEPASVAFCDGLGLDYVSCSPYRVPIARLAAAQAAIGKSVASQA